MPDVRKLTQKQVDDLKARGAKITQKKKPIAPKVIPGPAPARPKPKTEDPTLLKQMIAELQRQNKALLDMVATLQGPQAVEFPSGRISVISRDKEGRIKDIEIGKVSAGVKPH